ncbi:MAG: hypothetical protein MI974_04080 [Chitinophagales bacterium]|nr:hypothetical protein [Chitinophagales bacterium]
MRSVSNIVVIISLSLAPLLLMGNQASATKSNVATNNIGNCDPIVIGIEFFEIEIEYCNGVVSACVYAGDFDLGCIEFYDNGKGMLVGEICFMHAFTGFTYNGLKLYVRKHDGQLSYKTIFGCVATSCDDCTWTSRTETDIYL